MGTCGSDVQRVALIKTGTGVSVGDEIIVGVAVIVGSSGRVAVNVGKRLSDRDGVGIEGDKPGVQPQIKKTNKNIMIFVFFIILSCLLYVTSFIYNLWSQISR